MSSVKGKKDSKDDLSLNNFPVHEVKIQRQIKLTKLSIDQNIDAFEADKEARSASLHQYKSIFKIAAAILLVGSISFWFFNKNSFRSLKKEKYTTISSQQKERKKVTLPDGSIVWLNAISQISFSEDFNDELRVVNLTGEAFFEVKHNNQKPFIVKAGGLETQVLGTKFNIQAYPEQKSVDVALLSGKIAVSAIGNQAVTLAPHQSISLNKQTHTLGLIKQKETDASAAWHEGKIICRDQALEDVLPILERSFGLHISLKNKELSRIKINGDFSLNENPTSIVEELCKLIDARYKKEGSTITISKTNGIN